MPIIIKLQDIDEAIENLRYKNETTLKFKLLRAVRQYYTDETSAESLQGIDTEELVRTVWETGDDRNLLKAKRKNFSSLKSSVNSDLKKLYADGKNPQGIIIGHNNIFSISDEAKDKALAGIMDVFREKGIDTQSKISEILAALNDILSSAISDTDAENTKEEIERLKTILGGISGKLGLSLADIIRRAKAAGGEAAPSRESEAAAPAAGDDGRDLSGYIRGGLSVIDQGLQGLVREIEEASANATQQSLVESVRGAIEDIVSVLRDSKTDTSGKARQIIVSVSKILTETMESRGDEQAIDQAGRLKQIFQELTESTEGTTDRAEQEETGREVTRGQIAGGKLMDRFSGILEDEELSTVDKIGRIMAAVEDSIGEALTEEETGLNDTEIAEIRNAMASAADRIETLVEGTVAGIDGAQTGLEDSLRRAMTDILQTLRDTETNAADKAQKMITALQGVLDEALTGAGGGLPDDQAGALKQIFSEMAQIAVQEASGGSTEQAGDLTTPAAIAGGKLFATVSFILGDEGLSDADKVGRILAAVNDGMDEALAEAGAAWSDEEQKRIREVIRSITGGLGALAELEIVEEVVGEEAGESAESVEIVEEIPAGDAGQQSFEAETTDAVPGAGKILEVVEEVIGGEAGEASVSEDAGIEPAAEMVIEETGATPAGEVEEIIEEIAVDAGAEIPVEAEAAGVDAQESVDKAFADIADILHDTETDTAGKAAKIMAAVENLLGGSIDTADGFFETVSDILDEANLNDTEKLGKIIAAANDMMGDALAEAGTGLSDETQAHIREIMHSIGDHLGTLAGLEVVEEVVGEGAGESAGSVEIVEEVPAGDAGQQSIEAEATDAAAGAGEVEEIIEEIAVDAGAEIPVEAEAAGVDAQESVDKAFADITDILHDTETDTAGKAAKIMAAVEKLLGGSIDTVDGFFETVSDILDEANLNDAEKLGKIIAAANEMMGDVLAEAGTGLSDETQTHIREIMHSISDRLGTLAGWEVVEEVVREGAGESAGSVEIVEEVPAGDAGQQSFEAEAIDAAAGAGEILEVVEEVIGGEAGEAATPEDAGIEPAAEMMIEEAGATPAGEVEEIIEEIAVDAGAEIPVEVEAAGTEAGVDARESVERTLADITDILRDTETDAAGKAAKIMAAVEGMLSDVMEAAGGGFSGGEADELKQILHGITGGITTGEAFTADQAGNRLAAAVLDILSDGNLSAGEKLGKIMAAMNDLVDEALDGISAGLSKEDRERIREMMTVITGNLDALVQEALSGLEIVEEAVEEDAGTNQAKAGASPEAGADGTAADQVEKIIKEVTAEEPSPAETEARGGGMDPEVQESIRRAFADITDILQDTDTDAAGKAAKIIAAVEGILSDAMEAAGSGFSGGEADELKQILHGITGGISAGSAAADQAGSRLAAAVSDILGDGNLSAGDKISRIMTAVENLISETPGGEDRERLREMMANITGNLNALGQEALAGLEIVEETVEEGVGKGAADTAGETSEGGANEKPAGPEETGHGAPGIQVTAANTDIDSELREKTDLLTRLAEAAGVLAGLGPDLGGSIYTEEEIRGKAQFLSEEFDRYLSVRDKFYNAHVLIKGGDYRVGDAHPARSVLPEQIVTLQDFYIGKFPVTNALFEIFVEQTGYVTTAEKYGYGLVYYPRMQRSRDPITGVERFSLHTQAYSKKIQGACWHHPAGPDSSLYLKRAHPVVQVSLEDAQAFAVWTGKRLPTEMEWEAAARTAQSLIYPWGNEWQENACNTEKSLHGDTTPVDHYAQFGNSAGVADMLGNVLEWTSDVIGDKETSDTYIVKGASWIAHDEISLTDRHYLEKTVSSNIMGFRCVAI